MGPRITLFWTSGDRSALDKFQSQGGSSYLCASLLWVQQNPQNHFWCHNCWPLGDQQRSLSVVIHILGVKLQRYMMTWRHFIRDTYCQRRWLLYLLHTARRLFTEIIIKRNDLIVRQLRSVKSWYILDGCSFCENLQCVWNDMVRQTNLV